MKRIATALLAVFGVLGQKSSADYIGVSSTTLSIGLGPKTFTTQSGLAYKRNDRVRLTLNGDSMTFMEGRIKKYTGSTMTIDVSSCNGAKTASDWHINFVKHL